MIQAIFINNEVASAGATPGLFYQNFLIEGNRIESVHPHGIYVDDIMGLTIRNNVGGEGSDLQCIPVRGGSR